MVEGRSRFRVVDAATIEEARAERSRLQEASRAGLLPRSPRVTFGETAARWLADFEARVKTGERRQRTLEHYRHAFQRHLLPALGRRAVGPWRHWNAQN